MSVPSSSSSFPKNDILAATDQALIHLSSAREEINQFILGQDVVTVLCLSSLISGGHALLVGVPGLAKTKLVQTIGVVMGLKTNRIQCTPDLMPSDILGSEILYETTRKERVFKFIKGPVFTELLMADEINRASPRTQSALLESMEEKQVSIAGQTHLLPQPFHVLATQNPIEQEGTYPLPEAQLDRFLMQINIDYPDEETEKNILITTTSDKKLIPKTLLSAKDLMTMQHLVRQLPVNEKLVDQISYLIRQARPETTSLAIVKDYVEWGPGPRAGQSLMLTARALALLNGRTAPILEDVFTLLKPVIQHRLGLSFKARADQVQINDIIESLSQNL